MARLLADGGFGAEALTPLQAATEAGFTGLGHALGEKIKDPVPLERLRQTLGPEIDLDAEEAATVAALREGADGTRPEWLTTIAGILERIGERLNQWALD